MKTQLVEMKLKPIDKKKRETAVSEMGSQPEYPWGLSVRLEQEQLEKLGITDLPQVGSSMILTGRVEVTSIGIYDAKDGEEKNLQLQITAMALSPDKSDVDPAEAIYSKKK